ncbi:uncharacterized protein LOC111628097, partial [Centruroides sculpturatus]|uniref:uncharacterized protein LOC111628097 n=1 Tax=Centruroides sculpturatus TaxID=218467 RepID=UPI000C6EFECB
MSTRNLRQRQNPQNPISDDRRRNPSETETLNAAYLKTMDIQAQQLEQKRRIAPIQVVQNIESTVEGLKTDISNIKTDISNIKTDISSIKTDISTLITNTTQMNI